MVVLLMLFGAGLLWDALATADLLLTTRGHALGAWLTTAVLTILSCTVYNVVFVVDGWQLDRVLSLALGSATGAAGTIYAAKRWFSNTEKRQ